MVIGELFEELETDAGTCPAVHEGRPASRSEHRGHFTVDPDAVEAVFLQTAGQTARAQSQKNERAKERFHIASSSGHHNQDVKHRKPFFPDEKKNEPTLQCIDFTFFLFLT